MIDSISIYSCHRATKRRAVSGEKGWPYRDILSGWARDFADARTRKLHYAISGGTAAPVSLCRRVWGGFILRAGDCYGRFGDKYPSDIMDGICIRPRAERNDGTNPIHFARSSAGETYVTSIANQISERNWY